MSLVFLAWAAAMFRTLWRLGKRSAEAHERTGGGYFTWAGHSLRVYAEFLTSDKDRRERRLILFLTLLQILVIAGRTYLMTRVS